MGIWLPHTSVTVGSPTSSLVLYRSGVGKHRAAARCRSVKKLLPTVWNQVKIGPKVGGTTDIKNSAVRRKFPRGPSFVTTV